jgi:hypothetical protein
VELDRQERALARDSLLRAPPPPVESSADIVPAHFDRDGKPAAAIANALASPTP